jgi:hypothetical protein
VSSSADTSIVRPALPMPADTAVYANVSPEVDLRMRANAPTYVGDVLRTEHLVAVRSWRW